MHALLRPLVTAALAAACGVAAALTLADEPVGLGWSAAEVERASADTLAGTVARAARDGRLGCELHCERLRRIFDRLLVEARTQTARAARLPWSLTVVRLDDVDAFALPDGRVLVSESLIEDRGLSDEALAFVLAHEIAHSLLEHERQWLTAGRLLLPRQIERSVLDMYVEIDHNLGLLKALEPVLQQGELEADELGLLLAASAGFAPQRQIEFMQNEVAEDDGRRALAATHPAPLARLERLVERLPLARRVHEAAQR
ncbi:MAG TPA: M48 family metalloprotease [Methylibium sp.]|nr:M48 family metalloprotease [Methylibium sp.]